MKEDIEACSATACLVNLIKIYVLIKKYVLIFIKKSDEI